MLRKEYRETFDHLVNGSNESEEIKIFMEYIPMGKEPIVASWINISMEGNRRRISKGQIKPHIVMYNVVQSAYELAASGRMILSTKGKKRK